MVMHGRRKVGYQYAAVKYADFSIPLIQWLVYKLIFQNPQNCKLKEEALSHTLWRIRFGRGYGPAVRHNRMNEWMISQNMFCVTLSISSMSDKITAKGTVQHSGGSPSKATAQFYQTIQATNTWTSSTALFQLPIVIITQVITITL